MEVPYERLFSFLFLLTRCSGLFVFTPFFGSLNIPVQVRVLLAASVSYLFALSFRLPPFPAPWTLVHLLVGLGGELVIGMAMGFAAQAMFAGLEYAGQIIGFQIGLTLVNTIDPATASRSTILSVYQTQLGLMLFLGMNAHYWFFQAIADSLTVLPPYSMTISRALIFKLGDLAARVFIIGFQLAAPVTAVLVLTDVALGFIGRTAPQIQILVIGFPLKVLAGISALGLALYFFPTAFRGYAGRLQEDMGTIMQLLRN